MRVIVMRESCVQGEKPCDLPVGRPPRNAQEAVVQKHLYRATTELGEECWAIEVWSLTQLFQFIAEHGEGEAHIYADHEHYGCPVIEFRDA